MQCSTMADEDDTGGPADIIEQPKPTTKPSKRQTEIKLKSINVDINLNEEQAKTLKAQLDENRQKLNNLREQKKDAIGRRRDIDISLKKSQDEIKIRNNSLTKLKACCILTDEKRIDETIRRLNHDLTSKSFKLSQEKKIVAEIDKLERSKKSVRQYNKAKDEVQTLRTKHNSLRDEYQRLYKLVSTIKQNEDKVYQRLVQSNTELDKVKKELKDLRQTRDALFSDLKVQREELFDARKKLKEESIKRRQDERRELEETQRKEEEEIAAQTKPYEDEINICDSLSAYLKRIVPEVDATDSVDSLKQTSKGQDDNLKKSLEEDGLVLLRSSRDDDDDLHGNPVVRRSSSKKKIREKRNKKPMSHTQDIFAKFDKINLRAPRNHSEIPTSIEQLEARKNYYLSQESVEYAKLNSPRATTRSESRSESSGISLCDSLTDSQVTGTTQDDDLSFNNINELSQSGDELDLSSTLKANDLVPAITLTSFDEEENENNTVELAVSKEEVHDGDGDADEELEKGPSNDDEEVEIPEREPSMSIDIRMVNSSQKEPRNDLKLEVPNSDDESEKEPSTDDKNAEEGRYDDDTSNSFDVKMDDSSEKESENDLKMEVPNSDDKLEKKPCESLNDDENYEKIQDNLQNVQNSADNLVNEKQEINEIVDENKSKLLENSNENYTTSDLNSNLKNNLIINHEICDNNASKKLFEQQTLSCSIKIDDNTKENEESVDYIEIDEDS